MLRLRRGQVVFINSLAGLSARELQGPYAATKHALKAIAESLRAEVKAEGMRVLSVFLGKTATPMQEYVHRVEGIEYHPERLLQPEDVAAAVLSALNLPRTAEVTDLTIAPHVAVTGQLPGRE
jgi:NADP-dependent 3-hydroxy acid dehydrogenase YdfG